MKMLPVLTALPLIVGLASPASAARAKQQGAVTRDEASGGEPNAPKVPAGGAASDGAAQQAAGEKPSLDFDFFADQAGAETVAGTGRVLATEDAALAEQARKRRWMLKTHQTLGIATWLALVATTAVGQLSYDQLYGGGGGGTQWQTPHRALVISTSTLFAATATFALLAPTPYKKPLRLDTGLVHRIAVVGATLGMLTQGILGWVTARQAEAGNPHNLQTMARTHQIVGYTTLGFLTIAGAVWFF